MKERYLYLTMWYKGRKIHAGTTLDTPEHRADIEKQFNFVKEENLTGEVEYILYGNKKK